MRKTATRFIFFTLIIVILLSVTENYIHAEDGIKKIHLKNGITLLLKEDHSAPVVSLFVVYRVGSRNEQLGKTGISHLLEHMLFRGTKKYPPGKISRLLSNMGASYNAYTSNDITGYYETLPVEYFEKALEIESDRMINSNIDPEILKQEKTVVLSEIEGYENSPSEVLGDKVQAMVFIAHPYHWSIAGFKNDVANLTRDDLYKYYKTYYCPNNAVVAVVGDMEPKSMEILVRKYFENIKPGGKIPLVRSVEPPQKAEKRVIIKEKGKTSYIQVAYHIPSVKDNDIFALQVMDSILVNGKSSRLYKALIEKGLAAKVYSYLWENIDPGMYTIIAVLAPGKNIADLEKALLEELKLLSSETPINEKEIKKARNQAKAAFYQAKESITSQAENLGCFEAIHTYKYRTDFLKNIELVKESDIREVSRKYINDDNKTTGLYIAGEDNATSSAIPSRNCFNKRYFKMNAPGRSLFLHENIKNKAKRIKKTAGKKIKKLSFSSFKLSNGLKVIYKENHASPTISISGFSRAGCIYDPPEKAGLSFFTSYMLLRGNKSMAFREISEELDMMGSKIIFSGGREVINIDGWSLSENIDGTLKIISDSLINPTFPAAERDKSYKQILSKLRAEQDDPFDVAVIALREMIFPQGHPYHCNIRGYENTIKNITVEDLKAFHSKYYRPDSTVIVVVGDFSPDKLKSALEKYFGDWKAEGPVPEIKIPLTSLPERLQKKIIPMAEKAQVQVVMGNAALSRLSDDYYAFSVLNYILGEDTLTGRLGCALRDKEGLVYGAGSYLVPTLGNGPWVIAYGTNGKNVDKSLKIVKSVVDGIKSSPVSDRELKDAKSTIVNEIAVKLETNGSMADILSDIELFNLGNDYIERIPDIYKKITKEDLLRVAKKYIHPDKMDLVITGPYEEK